MPAHFITAIDGVLSLAQLSISQSNANSPAAARQALIQTVLRHVRANVTPLVCVAEKSCSGVIIAKTESFVVRHHSCDDRRCCGTVLLAIWTLCRKDKENLLTMRCATLRKMHVLVAVEMGANQSRLALPAIPAIVPGSVDCGPVITIYLSVGIGAVVDLCRADCDQVWYVIIVFWVAH